MSKILCSFSGKFGDILWSLATVKQIAKNHEQAVDFMCMSQYLSLLPLIQNQSYISKAFVNDSWLCEGSPHGDQPWLPQNDIELQKEYDQIYHLGYRHHPGIHYTGKALIDFIAAQQNVTLEEPVSPWIEVSKQSIPWDIAPFISYSFNSDYKEVKDKFWKAVTDSVNGIGAFNLIDVNRLHWDLAAKAISQSIAYIGCRSSNYVLANAVAQKNIFVYEPNPSRDKYAFHNVFGNPHWPEMSLCELSSDPAFYSPEQAASVCLEWIRNVKENQDANAQPVTR